MHGAILAKVNPLPPELVAVPIPIIVAAILNVPNNIGVFKIGNRCS
jgi:hypothetical protein